MFINFVSYFTSLNLKLLLHNPFNKIVPILGGWMGDWDGIDSISHWGKYFFLIKLINKKIQTDEPTDGPNVPKKGSGRAWGTAR